MHAGRSNAAWFGSAIGPATGRKGKGGGGTTGAGAAGGPTGTAPFAAPFIPAI